MPAYGRASVRDLIEKHAAQLAEMRSSLETDPLYVAARHDDLWMLRFLLSHKGSVSKAATAAKGALLHRQKFNLDDPALTVAGPAALRVPEVSKFFGLMKDRNGMITYLPDADRGPFLIITPALVHPPGIISNMTFEEQYYEQVLAIEWLQRQCDATSRRTGYLTKYVRLAHLVHRPSLTRAVPPSRARTDITT